MVYTAREARPSSARRRSPNGVERNAPRSPGVLLDLSARTPSPMESSKQQSRDRASDRDHRPNGTYSKCARTCRLRPQAIKVRTYPGGQQTASPPTRTCSRSSSAANPAKVIVICRASPRAPRRRIPAVIRRAYTFFRRPENVFKGGAGECRQRDTRLVRGRLCTVQLDPA